MTRGTGHATLATNCVLRPTSTEKMMPRLLRSNQQRPRIEAEDPARRGADQIDIVMDGQIVFSHAMGLQRV